MSLPKIIFLISVGIEGATLKSEYYILLKLLEDAEIICTEKSGFARTETLHDGELDHIKDNFETD